MLKSKKIKILLDEVFDFHKKKLLDQIGIQSEKIKFERDNYGSDPISRIYYLTESGGLQIVGQMSFSYDYPGMKISANAEYIKQFIKEDELKQRSLNNKSKKKSKATAIK